MRVKKITPIFPPDDIPHLTDWFLEIGPMAITGMGDIPLSHGVLRDWQANIGIELDPWECRTLIRMSERYAAEHHAAKKVGRPPPYTGKADDVPVRREMVDKQIDALFGPSPKKKP